MTETYRDARRAPFPTGLTLSLFTTPQALDHAGIQPTAVCVEINLPTTGRAWSEQRVGLVVLGTADQTADALRALADRVQAAGTHAGNGKGEQVTP